MNINYFRYLISENWKKLFLFIKTEIENSTVINRFSLKKWNELIQYSKHYSLMYLKVIIINKILLVSFFHMNRNQTVMSGELGWTPCKWP